MEFLKVINSKSKKIISFSLWGEDVKYQKGAISNVKLAQKYYPNWICRFHVQRNIVNQNKELLEFFLTSNNVEIIIFDEDLSWRGLFWRFLPCSDPNVHTMISRDCDSRIGYREMKSVKNWLKSNKKFHIMRDHPKHNFKILGGMWGVICDDYLRNMNKLIDLYTKEDRFNIDQEFLEEIIYPLIKNDCFVNDPFFDKIPFGTIRFNNNFVGNVYDENDCPNVNYKNELKEFVKQSKIQFFKRWIWFSLKRMYI